MDKLINTIQSCDIKSDKELRALKSQLVKSEELLFKNLPHLDDILAVLDSKSFTMGWVFILTVKTIVPSTNVVQFIQQAHQLIITGNTQQIRMVPEKFARICRKFTEVLIEQHAPLRAVRPMQVAINKLRPNSESLTPIHADFLQACLLAKDYRSALPVISEEVLTIANPEAYKFKTVDMLRYFYYGGMIFTGCKQYEQALEFFKMGFTAPALVLSAVMAECYKKYVLLSLLLFGQAPIVPKQTSAIVQRHLKNSCPHYQEFVNAYITNSTDEVHKVAEQHMEAFQKDSNFGLLKQCIQALYRSNIKRHTRTFLTLSLEQIADTVKLSSAKEAEKLLLRMIEEGEIFATINQKDGMVSFKENPEEYNDCTMLNKLDSEIKNTINLAVKVKMMDQEIASSPQYLQKISSHDRHGGRWDVDDLDMGFGGPPGFQRGPKGRKSKNKGKGIKMAN